MNRKKQTVLSIVFLFVLLMAVFTAFQSFEYESGSRILILQHNGEAKDPFVAAKTSQQIVGLLTEIVPSGAFLEDVFTSGFNVDTTYFGEMPANKLKKWKKTVNASPVADTGIIEITTFHTDRDQAGQINSAIINTIKTKSGLYYGRSEDISIKVINEPIVSDFPVRPNVLRNFILVILLSLPISFSFIYLFPSEAYDLTILPKRKKREKIAVTDKVVKNIENKPITNVVEQKIDFVPRPKDFSGRGDIKNIFDQSDTK